MNPRATSAVEADRVQLTASAAWRTLGAQPMVGELFAGRLHVWVEPPAGGRASVELELETQRPGAVGESVQRARAASSVLCVEPNRIGGVVFPVVGGWTLRARAQSGCHVLWSFEEGEGPGVPRPPWSVLAPMVAYDGGTQTHGAVEVGPAPKGARYLTVHVPEPASVEAAWLRDDGVVVVGWHPVGTYARLCAAHHGYHLALRNGYAGALTALVTWE